MKPYVLKMLSGSLLPLSVFGLRMVMVDDSHGRNLTIMLTGVELAIIICIVMAWRRIEVATEVWRQQQLVHWERSNRLQRATTSRVEQEGEIQRLDVRISEFHARMEERALRAFDKEEAIKAVRNAIRAGYVAGIQENKGKVRGMEEMEEEESLV